MEPTIRPKVETHIVKVKCKSCQADYEIILPDSMNFDDYKWYCRTCNKPTVVKKS